MTNHESLQPFDEAVDDLDIKLEDRERTDWGKKIINDLREDKNLEKLEDIDEFSRKHYDR